MMAKLMEAMTTRNEGCRLFEKEGRQQTQLVKKEGGREREMKIL